MKTTNVLDKLYQDKLDWFIDRRSGLHCIFCKENQDEGYVPLYNNLHYKRIVCRDCLEMLKPLIEKDIEDVREECYKLMEERSKKFQKSGGLKCLAGVKE